METALGNNARFLAHCDCNIIKGKEGDKEISLATTQTLTLFTPLSGPAIGHL